MADTSKRQGHLPDIVNGRLPLDCDNDGLRQFDSSLLAKAFIGGCEPNPRPCRCMEQCVGEPKGIRLGHAVVLEQMKNVIKRGMLRCRRKTFTAHLPWGLSRRILR